MNLTIKKCRKEKMIKPQVNILQALIKDIVENKWIYILALPVLIWYVMFAYVPMYGIVIAFKDFSPARGIVESAWAGHFGLDHFITFVTGPYFFRLLKNTIIIGIYSLVFVFPSSIIFALLLNEVKNTKFKKIIQTTTYLPHFISIMVVCGLIKTFVSDGGVLSGIIGLLGGESTNILANPKMFRSIYIISDIWQELGWGSIVYLAALTSVDPQLYEAATIDGASKLKKIWYVSLPGIIPTIVIMFILKTGSLMSIGYEKIILLYNEMTYEVADTIPSFVYRRGIQNADYSFSTAVGLFNSVVNLILVCISNFVSRRISETSLW